MSKVEIDMEKLIDLIRKNGGDAAGKTQGQYRVSNIDHTDDLCRATVIKPASHAVCWAVDQYIRVHAADIQDGESYFAFEVWPTDPPNHAI